MTTAKRVYLYLVSLVALVLLAVGVGRLFGLLLALPGATQAVTLAGNDVNIQQFSLSLAMILIGGGVWWGFWHSIQKSVAANPAETGAAFRKLYLNFIQTLSALIGLAAAIDSFGWLFGGLKSSGYPPMRLATFVVAAAVWYFHWIVSEKEGHPNAAAKTLRRWYIYILSGWGLALLAVNIVQFISNTAAFLPSGLRHWLPQLLECCVRKPQQRPCRRCDRWFFWFRMARGDAGSTLRQVFFTCLPYPVAPLRGW
jgi:hypothetical protein